MLPQKPQAYQIPPQDSPDLTLFEIENISKFSKALYVFRGLTPPTIEPAILKVHFPAS